MRRLSQIQNRKTSTRQRRARVFAVAALLGLAGCSGARPADHDNQLVYIIGDSITFEAQTHVLAALRPTGWRANVTALPGKAPCDYLPILTRELKRLRPNTVVIQTFGNALSPCMRDERNRLMQIGSDPYLDRYSRDLTRLMRAATERARRVILLEPIPSGVSTFEAAREHLSKLLRNIAARFQNAEYSSAPNQAVTVGGRYTLLMPCLAEEQSRRDCRNNLIQVRESFVQVHFCPLPYLHTGDVEKGCHQYSSGAVRYGRAIATLIAR